MTAEHELKRSTPESQGIASSAILQFVEAAQTDIRDLHSLMLLRNGRVVAEGWWAPYTPEQPHMLFSLSKSFTSSAVGLAVAEGLLSVDDLVLSFFPEDRPAEVSAYLATMHVHHLLSMSTGHAEETLRPLIEREDENWARAFLSRPVEYEPGTHFVYNSGATYMLSAIVRKVTGANLLEYLRPRLLDPLGIGEATWENCPRGINTGGWGLSITTEDIARFGQLYLQKGVWQGQRILPEAWVGAATSRQISNDSNTEVDWQQGYGYQFWRCRHGAYRGDGAFGQFCVVMPEQDAVLAITSGVENMQAVLNLAWDHLLPAMQAAPLPDDRAAHDALARKLASLSLASQQGIHSTATAATVSGASYALDLNAQGIETIAFEFGEGASTISARDSHGDHRIACGSGAWISGTTTLSSGKPQRIAASGAWSTDDVYVVKLCYTETPFYYTFTCRFTSDRLTIDARVNVAFGPTEQPQLVGRRV
jgi:CubicO group peptidase (beta-lactamase class C family)